MSTLPKFYYVPFHATTILPVLETMDRVTILATDAPCYYVGLQSPSKNEVVKEKGRDKWNRRFYPELTNVDNLEELAIKGYLGEGGMVRIYPEQLQARTSREMLFISPAIRDLPTSREYVLTVVPE